MYKNIVFDFGNVLVSCDTARTMRPYFADEAECEAFLQIAGHEEVMRHFDLEDIAFEQVIQALQQRYPQWAKQFEVFQDRAADFAYAQMPGMYALLEDLKRDGYHLYGLSNWGSIVHTVMARFPIFELLEGSVISSEEHLLKPDKAIYERMLQRFGLRREETLFTDDRAINIEGAERAGIHAVLFRDAQSLRKAIYGQMAESV